MRWVRMAFVLVVAVGLVTLMRAGLAALGFSGWRPILIALPLGYGLGYGLAGWIDGVEKP